MCENVTAKPIFLHANQKFSNKEGSVKAQMIIKINVQMSGHSRKICKGKSQFLKTCREWKQFIHVFPLLTAAGTTARLPPSTRTLQLWKGRRSDAPALRNKTLQSRCRPRSPLPPCCSAVTPSCEKKRQFHWSDKPGNSGNRRILADKGCKCGALPAPYNFKTEGSTRANFVDVLSSLREVD